MRCLTCGIPIADSVGECLFCLRRSLEVPPGELPPHARSSEASAMTAEAVAPKCGSRRFTILEALRVLGQRTSDELAVELSMFINSVAPEITYLKKKRLVAAVKNLDGSTLKRRTRRGCPATVWRFLPAWERPSSK